MPPCSPAKAPCARVPASRTAARLPVRCTSAASRQGRCASASARSRAASSAAIGSTLGFTWLLISISRVVAPSPPYRESRSRRQTPLGSLRKFQALHGGDAPAVVCHADQLELIRERAAWPFHKGVAVIGQ